MCTESSLYERDAATRWRRRAGDMNKNQGYTQCHTLATLTASHVVQHPAPPESSRHTDASIV